MSSLWQTEIKPALSRSRRLRNSWRSRLVAGSSIAFFASLITHHTPFWHGRRLSSDCAHPTGLIPDYAQADLRNHRHEAFK
jgi:hypothetical protein